MTPLDLFFLLIILLSLTLLNFLREKKNPNKSKQLNYSEIWYFQMLLAKEIKIALLERILRHGMVLVQLKEKKKKYLTA